MALHEFYFPVMIVSHVLVALYKPRVVGPVLAMLHIATKIGEHRNGDRLHFP